MFQKHLINLNNIDLSMYMFQFLIKMSWSSGENYSLLSDSDARLLQSFGQLKPRPSSSAPPTSPNPILDWTKSYIFCFFIICFTLMYVTMKEKISFYVPSKFEILHIHITKKKIFIFVRFCSINEHEGEWIMTLFSFLGELPV